MWEGVFDEWKATKAENLKAHREAGGLVVYSVEIERVGTSYDDDSVDKIGFFTTVEKAEAACASAQAELAPETVWNNHPDGSSFFTDDEGTYYCATIEAVIVL